MDNKPKKNQPNLKVLFEQLYKGYKSESLKNIFREVYGSDYPEEANPDGFITKTDLSNFLKHLNLIPGDRFIDLGCGRGGPGLWIARRTGANYVGVDLSENAIMSAIKLNENLEYPFTIKFEQGDFSSLNYPENYFNGAISIDALIFATNLKETLLEIRRILVPESNLVLTAWEPKIFDEKTNFRVSLINSGFKIIKYEVLNDSYNHQQQVYEKIIERRKILINDLGREAAMVWILDAKSFVPGLKKRIFVVANK